MTITVTPTAVGEVQKFMEELNDQAQKVQDVPPTRRREFDERTGEV